MFVRNGVTEKWRPIGSGWVIGQPEFGGGTRRDRRDGPGKKHVERSRQSVSGQRPEFKHTTSTVSKVRYGNRVISFCRVSRGRRVRTAGQSHGTGGTRAANAGLSCPLGTDRRNCLPEERTTTCGRSGTEIGRFPSARSVTWSVVSTRIIRLPARERIGVFILSAITT